MTDPRQAPNTKPAPSDAKGLEIIAAELRPGDVIELRDGVKRWRQRVVHSPTQHELHHAYVRVDFGEWMGTFRKDELVAIIEDGVCKVCGETPMPANTDDWCTRCQAEHDAMGEALYGD